MRRIAGQRNSETGAGRKAFNTAASMMKNDAARRRLKLD
jgi:hypothetical protein